MQVLHLTLYFSSLIIISITLCQIPWCLCAVDDENYYQHCNSSFDCANLKNLSYPFWGSENRPDYCGHPDFKLECNNGKFAEININSESYQVLEVSESNHSLRLVRTDFFDNVCPNSLRNNTIGFSLFDYGSDSLNLTLYYDCPSSSSSSPFSLPDILSTQFNCSINGTEMVDYFTIENKLENVDSLEWEMMGECNSSVIVPILESQVPVLERNLSVENLKAAINNGFSLEWNASNSLCDVCQNSDGICGYKPSSILEFTCYCRDGSFHPSTCRSSTKSGSSTAVKTGIAAGVSAAVACIIVGVGVFFVVKRRKKFAAKSKSNKDLLMPRDSGSLTFTSTTNSSHNQSVPSYVTSKSELSEQHSFLYGIKVFSYAELEEATKNFDPSVELGNGGFGTVYYGTLRDGRAVAVKRLYESNLKRVNQFRNEVEILARLQHPNLVSLFGCTSRHSRELLLVYEYIPNGTLSHHLHQQQSSKINSNNSNNNKPFLPWPTRLNIALETAIALAYLHKSDVIHRDVKTNNILLDNEFRVKVADFGLSRLFPTDVTHVSTAPQGTPGYVDPEYYQCYQLTDKSDVYSFGVVLIELLSSLEAVDVNRNRHFINLANMAVNKIQNRALHELVDPLLGFEREDGVRRTTTAVAELAFRCLQADREMRPSMDEVVQVLRGIIQNGNNNNDEEKGVIIVNEEVVLKNNDPLAFSPDSVVADKWVSSSSSTTTSNNSSS